MWEMNAERKRGEATERGKKKRRVGPMEGKWRRRGNREVIYLSANPGFEEWGLCSGMEVVLRGGPWRSRVGVRSSSLGFG